MKLNYDKKSKDPTYFIQHGFRNGKKTSTRNVARIGKHSELLKITDDPLAYAKEQVSRFNEEYKKNRTFLEIKLNFSEKLTSTGSTASKSSFLNIGYFCLQKLYSDLKLRDFFDEIIKDKKITFSPDLVNRFLVYARVLEPDSKLGTYDNLATYYEQPEFNYVHILRTMDLLVSNYQKYIAHLFHHSQKIVKRDTAVCYFDCTNFYFETETQDEDYIDEVTGETIKGLRKYGISKEHRPNPIVQMGLFMDAKGIPLSMCLNSGSSNEQTCAIPMEKELLKMFGGKPFIYCADAGLSSFDIRNFNSMGGRAFVVTQSVKKLTNTLQDALFNDVDYKLLSSDAPISIKDLKSFDKSLATNTSLYNDKAYKIIEGNTALDVGLYKEKKLLNGKVQRVKSKALLKQKIIITFSRKIMEYQREIRRRQIERAQKVLNNLDPETYKKGSHDVTRFIKRVTGSAAKHEYVIDEEVIRNEEKYDGFYAIATNLDDDAKTIIEINAQRYKIEECFRLMKTNLSARPVFHKKPERIIAHFMICFTALLIYRLLEAKLIDACYNFTTEKIIETLQNMAVINVQDMYYQSIYNSSKISEALNDVLKLDLGYKLYKPKELKNKIKKMLK